MLLILEALCIAGGHVKMVQLLWKGWTHLLDYPSSEDQESQLQL